MRNLTVFIRPQEDTVLAQPEPRPCSQQEMTWLVLAVMSAPANFLERSTIREIYPGFMASGRLE